ncbi:MAG: TauD/TfdA family dioxygenase [Proteobacteria bacterium]|nr:TauD/TfdA family dioxygenase [Pseudomonadota bacterium]MDA1324118.1 TauD/TfdA family dioxygenase [Pseudomonadota bacterium]
MDGQLRQSNREPASPGVPAVDPAAWYADDMLKTDEWLHTLSQAEIGDLLNAVAGAEAQGIPIKDFTRDNFPLPVFGPVLGEIYQELTEGRGFVLIRGLPVGDITRAQAGAAFYGMGTWLGRAVSQNPMGHVLGHVKDMGKDYDDPMARGYQTAAQMAFHSDQCDYVGLLCLQPSRSGGESLIVSSTTCYNEMCKRRPDLAKALCKDFYFTKHGEVKTGEDPWYRMPVVAIHEGHVSIRGAGAHVRKAQGLPGVPPFTEADKEALKLFQELATELAMPMEFQQGDIQLLHNHVMLHTRTAFEDFPEPDRKRHLMRLWLTDPAGRPTPPGFRDNISGIEVDGTVLTAPLDMTEAE